MAVTAPPALTAVPPFPALADRAAGTYNGKAYAFGTHLSTTFNSEVAAVAANVAANATDAAASGGTATAQAVIATDKATLTAADRVQTALDAVATASRLADMVLLYDQFDDRYLGAKAADPTLDNDGNPLAEGAFYISTVSGFLRGYTTVGGWVQGISVIAGVTSVNGLAGAVTLKTVNGAALTGSGDVVISGAPDFLLQLQGVI